MSSLAARTIGRVVVATDDERIRTAVTGFGGEVVMTAAGHHSGTDRVAEVALATSCQVILNIQPWQRLWPPGTTPATPTW